MFSKVDIDGSLSRSWFNKLGVKIGENIIHNQNTYVLFGFRNSNASQYIAFEMVSTCTLE